LKLSVLTPLYNEEEFVGALLEKVIAAPLPPGMTMEIIVADDGSTDSSVEEVEAVAARHPGAIRLLRAERNQGKGAALRRAIAEAQGDFAIIQDADLEYDPKEYPRILAPLLDVSRAEDYVAFRGHVDTVVCLNVLEHIEDDRAALRSIHETLQDGGRAIILVPEGQSLFNSLDEELGHCRRYSEDELRRRMADAGFAVETVLRFNRISRPGWWLNGKVLRRRTIGRFQLKIFDRMVWLFRSIDGYLPWRPTSIIAVGRKTASRAS
jgi:glycosyltransferase involved in cell wall biosynthesis